MSALEKIQCLHTKNIWARRVVFSGASNEAYGTSIAEQKMVYMDMILIHKALNELLAKNMKLVWVVSKSRPTTSGSFSIEHKQAIAFILSSARPVIVEQAVSVTD